jgi:hypothetical protein
MSEHLTEHHSPDSEIIAEMSQPKEHKKIRKQK